MLYVPKTLRKMLLVSSIALMNSGCAGLVVSGIQLGSGALYNVSDALEKSPKLILTTSNYDSTTCEVTRNFLALRMYNSIESYCKEDFPEEETSQYKSCVREKAACFRPNLASSEISN